MSTLQSPVLSMTGDRLADGSAGAYIEGTYVQCPRILVTKYLFPHLLPLGLKISPTIMPIPQYLSVTALTACGQRLPVQPEMAHMRFQTKSSEHNIPRFHHADLIGLAGNRPVKEQLKPLYASRHTPIGYLPRNTNGLALGSADDLL